MRVQFWTGVAMTSSAALSMALEIVAGRLLAPYVGMSLYSWTAIIAVVLAGLSLGHWLGGMMASAPAQALARRVAIILVGAGGASLASLFVLRVSAPPILALFDPISGIGALAGAAFFLPSVLAGLLAPILTAMALDASEPAGHARVLGRMFALGAVGAILGTVASGFVLLAWIGSHDSVLLIATLYLLLSLPFLHLGWIARAAFALIVIVAGPVLSSTGPAALQSPCDTESALFCIRVDPIGGSGRAEDTHASSGVEARVLALDHLAHGINHRSDPELIVSPYLQLIDEIAALRHPEPALAAFFVGGGAYTLPRAWDARDPEADLVVAEVDPEVTRVAAEALWLDPSGLEVHHGDARRVLMTLPPERRFDVIVGDAFRDVAIPQHLVTDEFHALLRMRLRPGGFYAMNVIEALREPPFLLSLARTLSLRFEHVELWLEESAIGPVEARTTWIVIASDRPTGRDRIEAARGLARSWVRVPTDAMARVLPEDRQIVLTDDHSPVDRLMRHIFFDAALAE